MREGLPTAHDLAVLQSRVGAPLPEAEALGILPTVLVSRRAAAHRMNESELGRLDASTEHAYVASRAYFAEAGAHSESDRELLRREAEKLAQDVPAPERLVVRVGSQVMIVKNLDLSAGIANGTRGVVTRFTSDSAVPYPVVRTAAGEMPVVPAEWKREIAGVGVAIVRAIPLQPAWALTQHKSQGQTLDFARVVLDDTVFDAGMAYVSLSRVRTLAGLSLESFDPRSIICDRAVAEFYRVLREGEADAASGGTSVAKRVRVT